MKIAQCVSVYGYVRRGMKYDLREEDIRKIDWESSEGYLLYLPPTLSVNQDYTQLILRVILDGLFCFLYVYD